MSKNTDPELMLDVSQAHELKLAFRRTGWNNAEIKKLSQGDLLSQVRLLVLGQAEIKFVKNIIDLDADPFTPDGWSVVEHRKGGQLEWNPENVKLHLSSNQQEGKRIVGKKLRTELKDQPVFNANLLDYLLKNPHLIPEEWKGKVVFFWGTVYRFSGGSLCVRCFYWDGGRWGWECNWLGNDWRSVDPAAVRA